MVRGYAPAIAGPSQSEPSDEIINARQEKVAFRALHVLERSNSPNVHSAENFSHDEKVYFIKRGPKFGE